MVTGIRLPFDLPEQAAIAEARRLTGLTANDIQAAVCRVSIDARRGQISRVYSVRLDAPFDEKLGVLGLLLSRLAETARTTYRQDALTDALHADLLSVREGEKTLGTLLDEKREALQRRRSSSTDRDALFVAAREVEKLDGYRQTLALEKTPRGQAFDRLKELFSAEVESRAAAADRTDAALTHAFAFLDEAIPDSQEMVLFATELTANWFTSWFIQNFGCDAYFAHNKKLLFDDTRAQLLQDIDAAKRE